jgi:hypothetical protein
MGWGANGDADAFLCPVDPGGEIDARLQHKRTPLFKELVLHLAAPAPAAAPLDRATLAYTQAAPLPVSAVPGFVAGWLAFLRLLEALDAIEAALRTLSEVWADPTTRAAVARCARARRSA